MKRSILVSGGSGFIGSNLVDLLIKEGHEVVVVDNLSTGLIENENDKATYFHMDITNFIRKPEIFENILQKKNIDTVYHLAASADVSLSLDHPEKVYEINLLSSISIVNICTKFDIKNFVFASTSAVYGEPTYLPVDEEHPSFPISPYGLTKLAFEQYLQYLSTISDNSYVIFRLPNVYGPRQRPDLEGGVIAIFDNLIKNNKTVNFFGDGSQTRDWVHVSDIILAFSKAMKLEKHFHLFSLGSGEQTSLSKLYKYMLEIQEYTKEPNFLDERSGDIKHMVMTNKKARKFLDWVPKVKLREGLMQLSDKD